MEYQYSSKTMYNELLSIYQMKEIPDWSLLVL